MLTIAIGGLLVITVGGLGLAMVAGLLVGRRRRARGADQPPGPSNPTGTPFE
jgi:hypothetical protein